MWNASLIVLVGISQKKILTLLYTQSVILGEKIYKKRYISLKKKNIHKPKYNSISRIPDVTIISWLVQKFIHIFEYKIGFHSKNQIPHVFRIQAFIISFKLQA